LSLLRCRSGTGEKCFFAKHPWSGLSRVVQRVDVGEAEPMLALDSLEGLMSLVQAGVVEIHPGARGPTVSTAGPADIRPRSGEDVPWSAVIAAAGAVRADSNRAGCKALSKRRWKGLHVVVPVEPSAGWRKRNLLRPP